MNLNVHYLNKYGFALYQNDCSLIKSIEIVNDKDLKFSDLTVSIKSEPEFVHPFTAKIEQIDSQSNYIIEYPKIKLNFTYLQDLKERIKGNIQIEITANNTELFADFFELSILPKNNWSGIAPVPEIIVAYIEPNNDEVIKILKAASKKLKDITGNSAINGYQSNDKTRVWQICAAIYNSICDLQITYSNPPASFEDVGQKIRNPNEIIKTKFATCLDITLLFCACIEQAGLNPIIFIQKGHTFAGVWLEEIFTDKTIESNITFFNKCFKTNDLISVETTLLTNDNPVPFDSAVKFTEKYLLDNDDFIFAVDVTGARVVSKIRPISSKEVATEFNDEQQNSTSFNYIPEKEFIDYKDEELKQKKRIDIWKSRLLDLSLRNNFINFKETQQTIRILCSNPAELEDELNNDKSYKIKEKPELVISNIRDSQNYVVRAKNYFNIDVIKADLQKQILHTPYTESDTNKRLLNLFRKQRLSEEESGTNTLFLSIGLLQWKESQKSGILLKSPILLVPVEIRRKSIIDGYCLQLRDDEPIINFTLLEKLENDFGIKIPGINPLPEDDSGVDVPKVWYLFRNEIKNKSDWDVLEEAWLGHFSFKKFLMWKDLQDNEKALCQNPLVMRILYGEQEGAVFESIELASENEVDTIHPSKMILPLSADSSQVAAILSVKKGKNLIIQGPPGTGKSQTITNLIANTLSSGKTVLFVSEKKVALEVVFKRLKEVYLEPFCLELHSNKSQKGEVIQSYKNALDYRISQQNSLWDEVSENLYIKKNYLNNYVTELHTPKETGFSIFDSYGVNLKQSNFDIENFNLINPESISKEQYQLTLNKLNSIKNYCEELNLEDGYVFKDCMIQDFDFELTHNLGDKIKTLRKCFKLISETISLINKKINFDKIDNLSLNTVIKISNLLEALTKAPNIPSNFLDTPQWSAINEDLKKLIDLKKAIEENLSNLLNICSQDFLKQNLSAINLQLKSNNNSWFLKKYFANRKLLKEQKIYFNNESSLSIESLRKCLNLGLTILELEFKIEEYNDIAEKIYGIRWNNLDSNALKAILYNINEIKKHSKQVIESIQGKDLINNIKLLFDNKELTDSGSQIVLIFKKFNELIAELTQELNWIEINLRTSFNGKNQLKKIIDSINLIDKYKSDLRYWAFIQKEAEWLLKNGYKSILDSLYNEEFNYSKLIDVFTYNFHKMWLRFNLNKSNVLKNFSSTNHNSIIADFHDLDLQHQQESIIKMIKNLLINKPMNSKMVALSSPISIINKESLKKRKQKSIRSFLQSIEPIMNTLKPCMLMSPLSVAQYLPPKQIFDLVIFDEASQITPWDAIGAIGRGKQVVVVGDSKQLPPTNLFTKTISDEFLGEEYEDLESILDECKKHLDDITLKWHYRSKYESLIAFSNRHIYENKLNTFPSNNIEDKAVSFNFVSNGIYDRGRSRTNINEAKAIVTRIINFLQDGVFSIGVITFNQSQSNKIEDLLFNEIRKHPDLDKALSSRVSDSIFIKNIENVQGDERDVILFSMTFGFDDQGVLTQRFSSLNSVGGHRRLNVAITRARQQIIVFSSIKQENIDLKKAKYPGVKLLREFLNYAEKGSKISFAEEIDSIYQEQFDSPFEEEVFKELSNLGWKVLTQIGVGNYRIDLGVIHPDKPGIFLAGIECDGKTYHSSKSARDRDILRQTVLENMGWKILRIWSTDWFYNKEKALIKIDNELNQLLSNIEESSTIVGKKELFSSFVKQTGEDNNQIDSFDINFCRYENVVLSERNDPEGFYYLENKSEIIKQLYSVVNKEAPILKEDLFMKIYKSWGLTRGGSRVNRILSSYTANLKTSSSNKRTFYWNETQNPDELYKLRLSLNSEIRKPKVICPQELAYGLKIVLEYNHLVSKEELFKKVNGILGWKKRSKSSDEYYEAALEFLCSIEEVSIIDNIVKYEKCR